MKNLKNILILITVVIVLNISGIVLYYLNFICWLNLFVYIVFIAGLLLSTKKIYDNYDYTSSNIIILSAILFFAFYIACEVTLLYTKIPTTCVTSYLFTEGYLISNACLLFSKLREENRKSGVQLRFLAIFAFAVSLIVGICNLFGLVSHR